MPLFISYLNSKIKIEKESKNKKGNHNKERVIEKKKARRRLSKIASKNWESYIYTKMYEVTNNEMVNSSLSRGCQSVYSIYGHTLYKFPPFYTYNCGSGFGQTE